MTNSPGKRGRPKLNAWRRTTAGGETKKIIVGAFWNSPQRIAIEPSDLMTDPDAFEQSTVGKERAR